MNNHIYAKNAPSTFTYSTFVNVAVDPAMYKATLVVEHNNLQSNVKAFLALSALLGNYLVNV